MAQTTKGIRSLLSHPAVYNLWGRLLGAPKARTDFVERYLKVNAGEALFDIGCGTGKMLEAIPDGVRYTGFDLSAEYVAEARRVYGNRGDFVHGRVGEPPAIQEGSQDVAMATGVLHHLDDGEATDLFHLAYRALRPGGRLITSDPVYVERQSAMAKFLISRDRGRNVRDPDAYRRLALGVFDNVEVDIRHDRLRIPYTHILMTCTK